MLWQNLDIPAARNPFSNLRIQLIERIATARLHIVVSVPFYAGDKEKRKYGVCHEHLISAVSSAGAAFALKVIAVLRRYHVDLSSRFCSAKRLNLLEAGYFFC